MINDTFILFTTENGYNNNMSDISEESLAFVSQSGHEKLITQNKSFYFIPSNGSKGQILRSNGSNSFYWDDMNTVSQHNSVNNIGVTSSIYFIKLRDTTSTELKFVGNFYKGQQITLYLTKDESSVEPMTVTMDNTLFTSLNNVYEFPIEKDSWWKLQFISDGQNIYVESNKLS